MFVNLFQPQNSAHKYQLQLTVYVGPEAPTHLEARRTKLQFHSRLGPVLISMPAAYCKPRQVSLFGFCPYLTIELKAVTSYLEIAFSTFFVSPSPYWTHEAMCYRSDWQLLPLNSRMQYGVPWSQRLWRTLPTVMRFDLISRGCLTAQYHTYPFIKPFYSTTQHYKHSWNRDNQCMVRERGKAISSHFCDRGSNPLYC